MRKGLMFAAALALAPAAVGQEPGDGLIAVAAADCARLVRHVPGDDVAYRPGVDVDGRPVAPADLGGGAVLAMPEDLPVTIEVDLAARYGLPAKPGLYAGKLPVGTVTLSGGRVLFNGQPMNDFDQDALIAACRGAAR